MCQLELKCINTNDEENMEEMRIISMINNGRKKIRIGSKLRKKVENTRWDIDLKIYLLKWTQKELKNILEKGTNWSFQTFFSKDMQTIE